MNVLWCAPPIVVSCLQERKEAEERERQQRIAEAEILNVNSARNVEATKLQAAVSEKGFQLKEVSLFITNYSRWSYISYAVILKGNGGFWKACHRMIGE